MRKIRELFCFLLSLLLFMSSLPLDAFAVSPIIVETFNVSFVDGADLRNGQYIWNPTEPAKGHSFVYRLDYSYSGTFSQGRGVLKFELPLHILKNRDGNWADTFDCPYRRESDVVDGTEPDFVWKIEGDKAVIYNYKPYPSGKAGYIEFSYTTTNKTFDYVDMSMSTQVTCITYATNDDQTVSKTATGPAVGIDTHVILESVTKGVPVLHRTWNSGWGAEPADADDWLYLTWPITSDVGKNTQPYDFSLSDGFSSLGGQVIGYSLGGRPYSMDNTITNQSVYGKRTDYVLTKHSRSQVNALIQSVHRYEVQNNVTATVTPIDKVDPSSVKSGFRSWWFEAPTYIKPTGHFWAEKYGIYGGRRIVQDSENISNYMLEEFQLGDIDSLDDLIYYTYLEGYPYPWTLGPGADGTVNDALNNRYGQKKVDYDLTDDAFYLEDETTKLNDDDYDIRGLDWYSTIRDATFDNEELKYNESGISSYKTEDAITISAKTDGQWRLACVYDLVTKSYTQINDAVVDSASGSNVRFKNGVKGLKVTCSNAYYHTKIDIYPNVSLYRTDHVLSLIGESTGKLKVGLTNQSVGNVIQNGVNLFTRTVNGIDYVNRSLKDSEIKKDIVQTRNDKVAQEYVVKWRSQVHEDLIAGDDVTGIVQTSGKFYDLLPAGGVLDKSTIQVKANNGVLSEGSYDLELIHNFRDSGRTMMVVSIKEPTDWYYELDYDTVHSWESIQDYGKSLLNSVAYESGNKRFTGGLSASGGDITDKSLMSNLGSTNNVYLYAEARYDLELLTAGSTGLMKQIRSEDDREWSYETVTVPNGQYMYQVRHENDGLTSSKDMIFFDSLESFYQRDTESTETIVSDWKGILQSVDVSQMRKKGVNPIVYLSKVDRMNIYKHHDLNEIVNGDRVWVEYNEFIKRYGIDSAHAVAVDARVGLDGQSYVLKAADSVVFTVYMKAPKTVSTDKLDAIAYNNIYIERSIIREGESPLQQFFHQDYTQIKYRVAGDVAIRKVDAVDMESPVSGCTFLLRGESVYGTDYDLQRTSDSSGNVSFRNIEVGTYELIETESNPDWQLNTNVYTVVVSDDGIVTIDADKGPDGVYLIGNSPRIHADLMFIKQDIETGDVLDGAKFRLSGTSDYGNDILLYSESKSVKGMHGRVLFENVELGTYDLVEIEAPYEYLLDTRGWKVKVDGRGVATMYRDDTEIEKNEFGYYVVNNEKSHSIRFMKSSSYGENIYLTGAEFELSGTSDYGTNINYKATSASESDGGLVIFDNLEPGNYILKETKAPDGHELDTKSHAVRVNSDGTFSIEGITTTEFMGTEVYDYKNRKTTGIVEVTKTWQDDLTNAERVLPDITLSTKVPSKSLLGTTVTYNANGGIFGEDNVINNVVYTKSGLVVSGKFKNPSAGAEEYKLFDGWYDSEKGGNRIEINNQGVPVIDLSSDVDLYAHWKTAGTRYAVSVWDIGVDKDQNGNRMGITFGPALGVNVYDGIVSHEPSGLTSLGNSHRCLHNDTWESVVEWNKIDPYVYEQCISEGCTKAIPIDFSGLSYSGVVNYVGTGDGLQCITIPQYYSFEGTMSGLTGYDIGIGAYNGVESTVGGWGASRLRASMNGVDSLTNVTNATGKYCSVSLYTRDNCLLACFPEVLQESIGKRAVTYCTQEYVHNSSTCKVSYDALWIPSVNEICSGLTNSSGLLNPQQDHSYDGGLYKRFLNVGTVQESANASNVQTYLMAHNVFNGSVSNASFFLRAICNASYEFAVRGGDSIGMAYCTSAYGYSPCFTLSR